MLRFQVGSFVYHVHYHAYTKLKEGTDRALYSRLPSSVQSTLHALGIGVWGMPPTKICPPVIESGSSLSENHEVTITINIQQWQVIVHGAWVANNPINLWISPC